MGQHKKIPFPVKIISFVFLLFGLTFIFSSISNNSAYAAEKKCLSFSFTMNGSGSYNTSPVCMSVENGKVKLNSASDLTVNNGTPVGGDSSVLESCAASGGLCTIGQYSNGKVYIGIGLKASGTEGGNGYGEMANSLVSSSGSFKVLSPIKDGDSWDSVVSKYEDFYSKTITPSQFYSMTPSSDGSYKSLAYQYKNFVTGSEGENTVKEGNGDVIVDTDTGIIEVEKIEDSELTPEQACFNNAGSFGWIMCPVIFGLESAVSNFYEAVEPFIQVDENIVNDIANSIKGDSSAGKILTPWGLFRNVANIMFVLLFLAVIFSQLTGYGIDNYGIKKMLPKIIITAILVNLSLIICAIAVDISNIVGSSVGDLLIKNAPAATAIGNVENLSDGSGAYVSAIVTAAAAFIGAGVLTGWTVIIPLLLFLLTMLVSIVFALIILGVRQALVIILIVVSPLAIVFYILPNTENIFKKWVDIFKKVLLVYPICGAVIGAGYFASHVLITSYNGEKDMKGYFMIILSGLLCVIPYFLIPTLLRRSVDGVGKIGERLGRLGNRVGGGMSRGINNSGVVRNARQNAQAAATRRRAAIARSTIDRATMAASNAAKDPKTRRGRALGWVAQHTIASNGRLNAVQQHANTIVDNSNQTARMNAQSALNRLNRMENNGYEAREAGLENKAFEDAVSDQSALLENEGIYGSNPRFEQAVQEAAENNDHAKLEALMRKAAKGSDAQREALRHGMTAALQSGRMNMSDQATRETLSRYGGSITGDTIFKNQNRSMHDQGQDIINALDFANRFEEQYNAAQSTQERNNVINDYAKAMLSESDYADTATRNAFIQSCRNNGSFAASIDTSRFIDSNYVGRGIRKGKQSASAAFSYDDGEFNALIAKMKDANVSDTEKEEIAKFMGNALWLKQNDATGQYGNVKREALDNIRKVMDAYQQGASTNTQFIQPPQDTLVVDHNQNNNNPPVPGPNPTPTPAPIPTPTFTPTPTPLPNGGQQYFDDNGNPDWQNGSLPQPQPQPQSQPVPDNSNPGGPNNPPNPGSDPNNPTA